MRSYTKFYIIVAAAYTVLSIVNGQNTAIGTTPATRPISDTPSNGLVPRPVRDRNALPDKRPISDTPVNGMIPQPVPNPLTEPAHPFVLESLRISGQNFQHCLRQPGYKTADFCGRNEFKKPSCQIKGGDTISMIFRDARGLGFKEISKFICERRLTWSYNDTASNRNEAGDYPADDSTVGFKPCEVSTLSNGRGMLEQTVSFPKGANPRVSNFVLSAHFSEFQNGKTLRRVTQCADIQIVAAINRNQATTPPKSL